MSRRIRATDRRAMVLLLVLVSVAAFALAVGSLAQWLFTERKAAAAHGRALQANALAESGAQTAMALLALDAAARVDAGGVYDNPAQFQGILVRDGLVPEDRGRFAVVSPRTTDADGSAIRFGLEDESARLNLNMLLVADARRENGGRLLLMALPGMTDEIADAILDWIDADEQPREFGAEAEYYSGLQPAYGPRNAPLEAIEELLLVRGVTAELLFGPDANRNGLPDGREPTSDDNLNSGASASELHRGWAGLITLHSAERNVRPDGTPKVNLNSDNLSQLFEDLSAVIDEEQAAFIVAYRQNGPYHGDGSGMPLGSRQLDLEQAARVPLASVLDLIDARTRVRLPNEQRPIILQPAFLAEDAANFLPVLMDCATVDKADVLPGRININQAPRCVLLALPGMTEELADAILSRRVPDYEVSQPERRHATWLLTEGVATLEEMRELAPFVTGQGAVYRAQTIGYFDSGGPAARAEIILDATTASPRLVSWKELSAFGLGYSVETLGTAADE